MSEKQATDLFYDTLEVFDKSVIKANPQSNAMVCIYLVDDKVSGSISGTNNNVFQCLCSLIEENPNIAPLMVAAVKAVAERKRQELNTKQKS